jgi:hypothetical protein
MSSAILLQDASELLLKVWPSSGWQLHSSGAKTGTETIVGTRELRASNNSAVDFAIFLADGTGRWVRVIFESMGSQCRENQASKVGDLERIVP